MQKSCRGIVRLLTIRYPDESRKRLAESAPIDPGVIPTDDAVRFESFDSLMDGWTREGHDAGQFLMRHAAVLGKQVNKLLVYNIHNLHLLRIVINDRSEMIE
jgi:hypothetical protein